MYESWTVKRCLGIDVNVIFIICLFLPEKIPIHFNAKGAPDMFSNKYYLLFATVIPYSAYWKFIRERKNKKVK